MIKYYLRNNDYSLKRGSDGAAGFDVRADLGTERTINPGERWKISTGLHIAMPRGVVAQICSRSGLAINHGIVVTNGPGIVDSDYRGEVFVNLHNIDRTAAYVVRPGDRIAQLLFMPVLPFWEDRYGEPNFWEPVRFATLAELGDTDRGENGHGSTGR